MPPRVHHTHSRQIVAQLDITMKVTSILIIAMSAMVYANSAPSVEQREASKPVKDNRDLKYANDLPLDVKAKAKSS